MEFPKLNDLILQQVFKDMNLNDRANLRLANRQFKTIVDQFSIENLVVFHRLPPIIDVYKFTNNERWTESDVVYVTDFNKFVERFSNSLKNVKRLVIKSIGKLEYAFNIDLKRLTHLELYNIKFKTANILNSSKLTNLHMINTFFCGATKLSPKKLENASISIENFIDIFMTIRYQEFDYLKLEQYIRDFSLVYLPPLKIRHLRIHSNFSIAQNFYLKYPTIKVLDLILIITQWEQINSEIHKLKNFLTRKQNDLTFQMLIYGIKVKITNLKQFLDFFIPIIHLVAMDNSNIKLILNDFSVDHSIRYIRQIEGFYNQIEDLYFEKNLHLFRKFGTMVNVRLICLSLTDESAYHFDHFSRFFPLLHSLTIRQKPTTKLSNDLFDHIVNFHQLYHLNLQCFEYLNFSFLFKMTNLKYLTLTLYYPIKNSTFVQIVKTLKYLTFFQVQFHQPADSYSKQQLSDFKRSFNLIVENDLKLKNFEFSILIQTKKLKNQNDTCVVLKYTYARTNFFENLFPISVVSDYQAVLDAIEYKGVVESYQNVLNDDCLLKIIKYLDFIDRTRCRLVSHQFLRLIDGLKTRKLVIFDRGPVLPNGKLIFTEEKYNQTECMSVHCISRFFNSQYVNQRLASIEKLVIYGLEGQSKFHLYATFEKLIHLELHFVLILDPTILKSPNIQNLVINFSIIQGVNSSFNEFFPDLMSLESKIKHLSISAIFEIDFYKQYSKTDKFSHLETLDCHLVSYETLIYISKNFKNLKTVNVRFAETYFKLHNLLLDHELDELLIELRPDLEVNLFGMPLRKSTSRLIQQLLLNFYGLEIFSSNLALFNSIQMIQDRYLNNEYGTLLDDFLKQIDVLILFDEFKNFSLFEKLPNVTAIHFNFRFNINPKLLDVLKLYPNITILFLGSYQCSNAILDKIPSCCQNLLNFFMESWDDSVNYNFLLGLKNIKTIRLLMKSPFEDSLFIEMLRNLKHLTFLEIYYEKSDKIQKQQLSSFKKLVQKCLFEELRLTDCVFKIEIHHRSNDTKDKNLSIVRYVLKRMQRDSIHNFLVAHDTDLLKMFFFVSHKRTQLEISSENDLRRIIFSQWERLRYFF